MSQEGKNLKTRQMEKTQNEDVEEILEKKTQKRQKTDTLPTEEI